jgi:hypothetical protein
MLTKVEIQNASQTLDAIDQEMWLALIRANSFYRDNKVFYPDVETELENASGTVKGQLLNAILDRIEALGVGEVSIKNGDEGLNYSQTAERDALVKYALSVLYDAVDFVELTSTTVGQFGPYHVRQRSFCGMCGCLAHTSWCSLRGSGY